ncbi:MAG TPA: hypothetical protein PLW81_10795 [Thiobacillaceae bacterium]|nr:hypothetical protein [Thiobacillaceae bacterium]
MKTRQYLATLLFALAGANMAQAGQDPLLTAMEESRASGKGLTFFVNGQAIPGLVVSVDDRHVIARSQAQGTIVIRLDRIDGVAGFIPVPTTERKAP